jgi:hypothetical protein
MSDTTPIADFHLFCSRQTTLVSYLNTLDVSIEEFYADVREAQHDTTDPYLLTFIDCLLASADYESFYKVMAREGEKVASRKYMGMKKNPVSSPSATLEADAKAESKSPSGRYDSKSSKDLEPDEVASDAKEYSHK